MDNVFYEQKMLMLLYELADTKRIHLPTHIILNKIVSTFNIFMVHYIL